MTAVDPGACSVDLVLEPATGKALPIRKGEILRIRQIEAGQPVELNVFNLHDHKEYMSVGHMRRESFRASEGRMVWSAPPRYRPMMKLLAMPATCRSDLLIAGCTGPQFADEFGLADHPNCQDTMAEAMREYGLTPDDTHDSLNLWMDTEWDHVGVYPVANTGRGGDLVDMLALMDVLVVVSVCGAAALSVAGNFAAKPVGVQVLAASPASAALAEQEWEANCFLKTQRTLDDFPVKDIRRERALLAPNPAYTPNFVNYPIEWTEIDIEFTTDEIQRIWPYRGRLGDTDEEVVRTLFFHWYVAHRKKHGLRFYAPSELHR